jgi:chromosome segregation ATPase
MFKLAQIYDEARYDLSNLLDLHRLAKALGLAKHDIIIAFELIKHNQLQTLQWKAGCLRSELNTLELEKTNSTNQISKLKWMIHEHEETLAQKRAEMAYLNTECRKLRQRLTDYYAKLSPITESKPDTDSDSTQIVPYNKE